MKDSLYYEWEKMDIDYIKSLVESFPRRIWELYQKRDRETKY